MLRYRTSKHPACQRGVPDLWNVIAARFLERILAHKEYYVQSPLTAFAETESGVRSGKLNHPKGTFHYGPIAAVLAVWMDSRLRLVASEFCRFPRRIVAMWRDAGLKFGPAVPSDPRRNNQWSLAQESIFLFSCSDSIKQLSQRHVWMGPLDQQLAGEAFQAGASWAFRNQDSGKTEDGTVSARP